MAENADCIKISITPAQYQKIITFIEKSFQTDEKNSHLLIKDASYGNNDLFYEAKGRYSFLYICNTWANECLKNAELKASLWTLTDGGIFAHYRK